MRSRFSPAVTPLETRFAPAVIGTPDATFGYGGRVTVGQSAFTSVSSPADVVGPDAPPVVAVQPDGRVFTLAATPNNAALVLTSSRPDGKPDPAFGNNGRIDVGFNDPPRAGTVRPLGVVGTADGRVTVVAAIGPADGPLVRLGLLRYDPLGHLDPSFADGGQRRLDLPAGLVSGFAGATAVAVPGGIAVAVPLGPPDLPAASIGVLRLTANGDSGGWQVVPFSFAGAARLAGLAAAPDGGLFVGGTTPAGSGGDLAVLKLTPDGRADAAFGVNGVAAAGFDDNTAAGGDRAAAVAALPDGRVLVAGAAGGGAGGTADFGVVRFTSAGQPDQTFGDNGRARAGFDSGGAKNDRAAAVAVQADGRVVLAGAVELEPYGRPDRVPAGVTRTAAGVVRLTADGRPDASFGPGGKRVTEVPAGYSYDYGQDSFYFSNGGSFTAERAEAVGVLPSGRVVLGLVNTSVYYNSYSYYYYQPGSTYYYGSVSASVVLAALVGRVDVPVGLAVGGPADGRAAVLDRGADGTYAAGQFSVPFAGQTGGVRVARADFDGDGVDDVAYATGPGGPPRVRVVDGRSGADLFAGVQPFEDAFTGGLLVSAADLDGDGRAELAVSADRGGGPRVRLYRFENGLGESRLDFFGIDDPAFRGGARTAFGDVNGDSVPDLIVGAGYGGGPRVALFDGRTLLLGNESVRRLVGDFLAYPAADAAGLRDGVYIAAGDLTGDGAAEVVVGAGPGGGPRVIALDGPLLTADRAAAAVANPVVNLFAGDPASRGGVRVAVRDTDGDGAADLVTGAGVGGTVRVYKAATARAAGGPEQTLDVFADAALTDGVYVG